MKNDYKGYKNICGERIKCLRQTKKLSQLDLAARMEIQEVYLGQDDISRIENGTRSVTDYELFAFSKALNVSILEILDETKFL